MFSLRTLVLIGSMCSLSCACSDDDHDPIPEDDDGPVAELADVVFVNEISDEALERMLERAPVADDENGLEIFEPSADEVLDGSSPTTFKWRTPPTAARAPSKPPVEAFTWSRFARGVRGFLSPIGIAHAHGPTFNGTAYFLVFSTATNPKVLRVFTAGKSFTPDPESWDKLVEAQGRIELEITSAIFEESLLATDGGPFLGSTVTFTVE